MSKFDEILDDVIYKAKIAADIAGKKTNEMVEMGKLKYKAKQVSWEIEKAYAKLGALVYEARKGEGAFDDVIMLAMDELDTLNERLDRLEDKLEKMRIDAMKAQRASRASREVWEDIADEADIQDDEAPEEAPEEVPEDKEY